MHVAHNMMLAEHYDQSFGYEVDGAVAADPTAAPFGCFISGPSKTADIEQALVFGAHGAREVTVIITDAR